MLKSEDTKIIRLSQYEVNGKYVLYFWRDTEYVPVDAVFAKNLEDAKEIFSVRMSKRLKSLIYEDHT